MAKFDPLTGERWISEYDVKMTQPASRCFSNYAQLSRIVSLAAVAT